MARRHRVYRQIEGKKRYEHRAKAVVSVSFLVLILAFPLSVYKAKIAAVIDVPSAMDVAQVARNLACGGGFTTNIIQPNIYSALPRFTKPPDIVNPPLHVWLLAWLPGMGKGTTLTPPDSTVINFSSFFYLLTAMFVFMLERRICGNKTFSIAALICLFSMPLLRAAVSGDGETLCAAMITLLFLMVYIDKNQSFLYSFLVGAVLGLCYLTSYVFLAMLIPLIAHKIARGGEGLLRHLGAVIVGVIVVSIPWMLRNMHFGGNVLIAQPFYAVFLGSEKAAGAATVGAKLYLQFFQFYGNIVREYGGVFVLAFFVISPLVRSDSPEVQGAKVFLWTGLALVFLFSMLGKGGSSALTAFLPGAILLGSKTFIDLIPRQGGDSSLFRNRVIALFIALNLMPFAVTVLSAPAAGNALGRHEVRLRTMADMHSLMHAGEIMMTNAPEWMSYYGEFNTLPIPRSGAELKKWEDEFGHLCFAAVCPYGVRGPVENMILNGRIVPSWFINDKAHIYPEGENFFVVAEAEDITVGSR